MLPLDLVLHNWLTYADTKIDFRNIRKTLILGLRDNDIARSIGSGKSNLLRAIPWCLWGINPDKKNIDDNVRWGTDACSVQFDFQHHNKFISVIRTRNSKLNKSTLVLFIDGVDSSGNSIAETTQKITELLNLDYNAYVNSCYIRQNDIYSLANTEDKNQSRELFEKLMGLTIYDEYFDACGTIVDKLERERDDIFAFINENANLATLINEQENAIAAGQLAIADKQKLVIEIQGIIETKSNKYDSMKVAMLSKEVTVREHASAVEFLKKNERELSDLETRSQRAETEYNRKYMEYKTSIAEAPAIEAEIKAWDERVVASVRAKGEMDELDFKIESKRGAAGFSQQDVNRIEARIGIIKHDAQRIKAEIDTLTAKINNPNIAIGSKCDRCLTDITTVTLDHYVDHLNADIITRRSELDGMKAQVMTLTPEKDMHAVMVNNYQNSIALDTAKKQELSKQVVNDMSVVSVKQNLQRRLNGIEAAKIELANLEKSNEIQQWRDSITKKSADIKEQQLLVDDLATKLDMSYDEQNRETIRIKDEIDQSHRHINSLDREIHLLQANVEMAKKKIEEFDIMKQKLSESQDKLAKIESDLVTYKELLVAFSPKGIRYHILGKAIEELEREANNILPKLSHGNLRIRFQTKKEVQKSKRGQQEKLVFEAFVNDGQKEQSFSSYSGGEQFMISFVIRVALSNLLLKRANADLQFLVIDEAISPLDQAGIEMIIPTINELQNYFKVILVITHRSDVKQYFDEVITVKRNKYTSYIEA